MSIFRVLSTHKFFNSFGSKNVFLFYLLNIFSNGWFIMGNWFFFWLKYMTITELGWFDAISFGIGMLMEIPSGAIADLWGKKNTLIVARLLGCIGVTMMALAGEKYMLLGGNTLVLIGLAFYSGAAEALAYDTLVESNLEDKFDKVISNSTLLSIVSTVITSFVGGALYAYDDRFPWFAWAVFNGISLLITFFLKEPSVDTEKFSFNNYFLQMSMGFKHLFSKSLLKYLPLFIGLLGAFYMYETGFIRPAIAEGFGFKGEAQSYISAIVTILAAVAVTNLLRIRQVVSDKVGIVALVLGLAACFFAAGLAGGMIVGFMVLALVSIIGNLAFPWISILVNKELESKYRATSLSVLALLTKLPYVLVSILAGGLLQSGKFNSFNITTGMLLMGCVLLAGVFTLYAKKVE